jgi:hypothetical protein
MEFAQKSQEYIGKRIQQCAGDACCTDINYNPVKELPPNTCFEKGYPKSLTIKVTTYDTWAGQTIPLNDKYIIDIDGPNRTLSVTKWYHGYPHGGLGNCLVTIKCETMNQEDLSKTCDAILTVIGKPFV